MKNVCYLLAIIFFISCTATKSNKVKIHEPVRMQIVTDSGTMVIKLYDQTPLHRDNFIKLVKEHFYDSLLFHRVIKNFMIQGGDPGSKYAKPGELLGEGGLRHTIPAEFDTLLFHKKGAVAAAREGDEINPQKESSGTQFYIVEGKTFTDDEMDKMETRFRIKIPESHRAVYRSIGGTPFLDGSYTVFGEVVSGLDVIDKIANAPKDANDRPLHDIRMKITILKGNHFKK